MHGGIRHRRGRAGLRLVGHVPAVLLAVLAVAMLPGVAWAAGPLVWSSPRLVDHSPYQFGRPGSLVRVSCVSGPLCVAVDTNGAIVTSTDPAGGAGTWTLADVDGSEAFSGVSCASASLCVAVERNGSIATSTDPTGATNAWRISRGVDSHGLTGVSCAPAGSLCVAIDGAGNVVTSTDPGGGAGTWRIAHVDNDHQGLAAVSCPSASLCVAVSSQDADVVTSTNPAGGASAWSRSAESGNYLADVSCPSASLCVGVDFGGNVATTSDPAGGVAWATKQVEPTVCLSSNNCSVEGLTGVSCPSASFCAAFDGNYVGNVLTSTDPAGGARAWKPGPPDSVIALSCALPSLCVGVGFNDRGVPDGHLVASTNATARDDTWRTEQIEGVTMLNAVSCPSASLCVAGDTSGDAVTSTDPGSASSSWDPVHIDPRRAVQQVACRSASLCVAVDDQGAVLTSSHPTAGAHAWRRVRRLGDLQVKGVSCPSASLCVAVGVGLNIDSNYGRTYVATSTHPTVGRGGWVQRPVPQLQRVSGVSCPSVSFCAAVLANYNHRGGRVAISTDPRGGARAWRSAPLHNGSSTPQYVSCPSRSLCVALDDHGNAFTSAHPGGRRPWRRTRLISGRDKFTDLSCRSVHLCVASDDLGNILSTTDPTGGRGSWTSTHVEGNCAALGDCVLGVSCPSASLCIAVDSHGGVLLGTRPRPGTGRVAHRAQR